MLAWFSGTPAHVDMVLLYPCSCWHGSHMLITPTVHTVGGQLQQQNILESIVHVHVVQHPRT